VGRGSRGRLVEREVLEAAVLGRAATAASVVRSLSKGQEVEIPAGGVLVDGERLRAGREGDGGGYRSPGLITAGARDGHGTGQVGAGGVGDVQRIADRGGRGHPEADRVGPCGTDFD